MQSGDVIHKVKEHKETISDIQNSKDRTMFITASKDNVSKVRVFGSNTVTIIINKYAFVHSCLIQTNWVCLKLIEQKDQ